MIGNDELLAHAQHALESAYAPYSKFKVGAALLAGKSREDNHPKIYTSANIENVSFAVTCCAERIAFYRAWMDGGRYYYKIAIMGGRGGTPVDYCPPCGICRQTMREFCDDSFQIIVGKSLVDIKTFTLQDLLPNGFCTLN